MCCWNFDWRDFVSQKLSETSMTQMAVVAVFFGVLATTDLSRGEDQKGLAGPKPGVLASKQPANETVQPPAAAAAPEAPADEGHVRHHGALGLLMSKAQDGVLVVGVMPQSPAAHAGMKIGDEVLYIGDTRIHSIPELMQTVGSLSPGVSLEIVIRRNGKRRIVEAVLADRGATVKDQEADRPAAAADVRGQSPAAPKAAAGMTREQQLNQRMRLLEKQVYLLQQSLNELRYAHSQHAADVYESAPSGGGVSRGWYQQEQSGAADDDPAVFQ